MRKFCCFVRYAPQPELGLCLRKPDLRILWPKRWQLDGHCRNVLCGAQVRCRRRADQVWKGEPGESRAVEAGVRLGKEVGRVNSWGRLRLIRSWSNRNGRVDQRSCSCSARKCYSSGRAGHRCGHGFGNNPRSRGRVKKKSKATWQYSVLARRRYRRRARRACRGHHLWRFVSVAGHKIRLQIEKSPFLDTVPGLHHKKPAEVRLDKKDVIMRLKKWVSEQKNERAYTKMRKIKGEYRIRRGYKSNTTVHWRDRYRYLLHRSLCILTQQDPARTIVEKYHSLLKKKHERDLARHQPEAKSEYRVQRKLQSGTYIPEQESFTSADTSRRRSSLRFLVLCTSCSCNTAFWLFDRMFRLPPSFQLEPRRRDKKESCPFTRKRSSSSINIFLDAFRLEQSRG